MLRFFRRAQRPYAFVEAMVGVKMGERLLIVGAGTPSMLTALAGTVGLTGQATAIVDSDETAEALREAAAQDGVLLEIERRPAPPWSISGDRFDVAVVDSTAGFLATRTPERRVALLRELRQSLRSGGRAIVIERVPRGGLAAIVSRAGPTASLGGRTLVASLEAEGFRPVRLLAEREGYRFAEGLNPVND